MSIAIGLIKKRLEELYIKKAECECRYKLILDNITNLESDLNILIEKYEKESQ